MPKKKDGRVWVYKPAPTKFTADKKEKIIGSIKEEIKNLSKLSRKVSRVDMRSNRLYLYTLVEQFMPKEGDVFIKPLIDGKYLEFPYARITFNDTNGVNCNLDWQRHNDQWITLHEGSLTDCLLYIENDNCWFAEV